MAESRPYISDREIDKYLDEHPDEFRILHNEKGAVAVTLNPLRIIERGDSEEHVREKLDAAQNTTRVAIFGVGGETESLSAWFDEEENPSDNGTK